MLHVLSQAGALPVATGGRVLVSGKCPCASCDAFISSNNVDVHSTFGDSIMIGYNYGWRKEDQKAAYHLNCVQLVAPTRAKVGWPAHVAAHVSHMGTTPIGRRTRAPGGLKIYVIGASFGPTATIACAKCTASSSGRGPCTIGGRVQPIKPTEAGLRWDAAAAEPVSH